MIIKQLYKVAAFWCALFFLNYSLIGQEDCIPNTESQISIQETILEVIIPCDDNDQVMQLDICIPVGGAITISNGSGLYNFYSFTSIPEVSCVASDDAITCTNSNLNSAVYFILDIPLEFCTYDNSSNYSLTYTPSIGFTVDITNQNFQILEPNYWGVNVLYTGANVTPEFENAHVSYEPNNLFSRTTTFTNNSGETIKSLFLEYQLESEVELTSLQVTYLDVDMAYSYEDLDQRVQIVTFSNPLPPNGEIVITETLSVIACSNEATINDSRLTLSNCDCVNNSFSQPMNIIVEDADTELEYCFAIYKAEDCSTTFDAIFTFINPPLPDDTQNPGSGHKELGWIVLPVDMEGFTSPDDLNADNYDIELRFYPNVSNPLDDFCDFNYNENYIEIECPTGFANMPIRLFPQDNSI